LGFDINASRIEELEAGKDKTLEVSEEDLLEATHLTFSCDPDDLNDSKIFYCYSTHPN
jgi:UDP-N-acetyl-D-galactosamine dehydrogenase